MEVANVINESRHTERLLFEAINETTNQMYREVGTKVIYDYAENNSSLKGKKIAEKPEAFYTGLERLLSSAASVIGDLILENLYRKPELKFEEKKGYEFSDYVKEFRKDAVEKG